MAGKDDDDMAWLAEQLDRSKRPADEPDPELLQLRPRINWIRPFLMLAVIGFSVVIVQKFWVETSYFFSSSTPIELGDATDFPGRALSEPGWAPDLQHNRLVSLSGIPSRRTITCNPPTRYFKLIGSHLYVEQPMTDAEGVLECEKQKSNPDGTDIDFFNGAGRIVSMDRIGPRYDSLKGFYETNFGELFCDTLTEPKKQKRLEDLRQILRGQFHDTQKRYPTDAELEQLLQSERVCHDAWILQVDRDPASHWTYLALTTFLGLVSLWNLAMLLRWIVRTIQLLRS